VAAIIRDASSLGTAAGEPLLARRGWRMATLCIYRHCGRLIEAPWLANGAHGAPLRWHGASTTHRVRGACAAAVAEKAAREEERTT
jgi:hypothetical protein